MKLIKCECLADGSPGPAGQFLSRYDPKTGESVWTVKRCDALQFTDIHDALSLWKSVHEKEPIRPDGKPNRPLTAFSVTIEDI